MNRKCCLHNFTMCVEINNDKTYVHTPLDDGRKKRLFEYRSLSAKTSRDLSYSGEKGHISNGDEQRYSESLLATFTKGLFHNRYSGVIEKWEDFYHMKKLTVDERSNTESYSKPNPETIICKEKLPHFKSAMAKDVSKKRPRRSWDIIRNILSFDLHGPDSTRVTMPPAPSLNSLELSFEMTELYWMALLRDKPFNKFCGRSKDNNLDQAVDALNYHPWRSDIFRHDVKVQHKNSISSERRLEVPFSASNIFRGKLPGDSIGPYLSQFLLVGSDTFCNRNGKVKNENGVINYGSCQINQRVRVAEKRRDYMTSWGQWFDIQNGADVCGLDTFVAVSSNESSMNLSSFFYGKKGNMDRIHKFRFIATPRDLSTYVHYDLWYQPYLNACLILFSLNAPMDPGLRYEEKYKNLKGNSNFDINVIMSMISKVTIISMKAVYYQKYYIHRRARPESIGALIDRFLRNSENKEDEDLTSVAELCNTIDKTALIRIGVHNRSQNQSQIDDNGPRSGDYDPYNCKGNVSNAETFLLPIAYPEGSPMSPSYGSSHAAVAGACVTVLKAFFDGEFILPFSWQPSSDGSILEEVCMSLQLSVDGELNKLCSNISLGRAWAGVNYFSDYAESIKLGEEISICALKEERMNFGDEHSLKLSLFNGKTIRI